LKKVILFHVTGDMLDELRWEGIEHDELAILELAVAKHFTLEIEEQGLRQPIRSECIDVNPKWTQPLIIFPRPTERGYFSLFLLCPDWF
jgi:hypothetical protein